MVRLRGFIHWEKINRHDKRPTRMAISTITLLAGHLLQTRDCICFSSNLLNAYQFYSVKMFLNDWLTGKLGRYKWEKKLFKRSQVPATYKLNQNRERSPNRAFNWFDSTYESKLTTIDQSLHKLCRSITPNTIWTNNSQTGQSVSTD